MKKSFVDTKGVIRRHKSKYRHDNEKIKRTKRQLLIYKLYREKIKIEQHENNNENGNSVKGKQFLLH